MTVISIKQYPKATRVLNSYWEFAAERQRVFFKRFSGESYPWTENKVITEYKFTNAYRASDRTSQYLIKNVIYKGSPNEQEVFFRIILFKLFNRISTWELLSKQFGQPTYSTYAYKKYDKVLTSALKDKEKIYSAAYIMPSGQSSFGLVKKHQNNLKLIELLMRDKTWMKIIRAKSMKDVYLTLLGYPTLGSFLSYQYTIDINYSRLTDFDENDFVVPGPGALDGIAKCFSNYEECGSENLIRYVTQVQESEFKRLNIKFEYLWGRKLKLIDCQNLFCEVSKYSRIIYPEMRGTNNRKRIKQRFEMNPEQISYWYPPKWNINHLIK